MGIQKNDKKNKKISKKFNKLNFDVGELQYMQNKQKKKEGHKAYN